MADDNYPADYIRGATGSQMRCPACGSKRLITASGLVCERGCGRLAPDIRIASLRPALPPTIWGLEDLRRAWKRRAMRYVPAAATGGNAGSSPI